LSQDQKWTLCQNPEIGDILRWDEPLWAAPNKPRGKPDKIGEQQIVAQLMSKGKLLELTVVSVTKLSPGDVPLKVKEGDNIRRRKSSLESGMCHKRVESN